MQKLKKWTKLLAFLILLNLIQQSCCESPPVKKKRNKYSIQDASVYPGGRKTGLRLDYSELADFSDLPELGKAEGFLGLGLFCVKRGAWLLYRKTDYETDLNDNVKVASGKDKCFKPIGIESAQPIGPLNAPKMDSITFFFKPNFGGVAHPTSKSAAASFFRSARKTVKSLIIIGRQNWTITLGSGRKFCLQPRFGYKEETSPICMLPDLTQTKIGRAGVNIIQVLRGCDKIEDDKKAVIDIGFCSFWGNVPDSKKPALDQTGMSGRTGDISACSGGGDEARKLQETLKLYKSIITNSFDSMVVLEWPELNKNKWRLELLDTIFDIAKVVVPPELIPGHYVNRIRELFVYQLAQIWKEKGFDTEVLNGTEQRTINEVKLGLLTEYDYRGMLYQTTQCLSMMNDGSLAASNRLTWNAITDPDPAVIESTIWKDLLKQKDANIVTEMTWLITNMVGGLCHKQFGYAHNYWALYIHLVNRMYLKPMFPKWKEPIPDLNFLLGWDKSIMYDKLAVFTSMSLFASNSMEPFKRPKTDKNEDD